MDFYTSISMAGQAEFKDRGSRFIAYAFPIQSPEDFKKHLQHLKKEHPKAVHHCFAYRLGYKADNFRSSDDGEPSGTAGKPILGQIDSKGLSDVAVIVVRYFGGSLLGVPGLINAYKTVTSLALQVVPSIQKPILANFLIQFDYTSMNDVQLVCKQLSAEIIEQEIQLFCRIKAGIPKSKTQEFLYRLQNLRNVEVEELL